MSIESEAERLHALSETVSESLTVLVDPFTAWLNETTRTVQLTLGHSAGSGTVMGLLESVRSTLEQLERTLGQVRTAIVDAAGHHGRRGAGAPGMDPPTGPRSVSTSAAEANNDNGPRSPTARATFGRSESTNYKRTFFEAHPDLSGTVWVHHAVEQQAMDRFPDAGLTPEEIHSLENPRGIPTGATNNRVHLSAIRKEWNIFYRANKSKKVTKEQLLDWATSIDEKYGTEFRPPVR
ncbi:hypothetical protein [Actinokineospora enzanensis]|uniref:hypothetical protein n=1 Tax=Actinokineospora enzanensis TaxID=155975 RepID=UPI00035EC212|nr:hypothetical protein [Actinokineospora enzanensis]